MQFTARELCALLDGDLEGNANVVVTTPSKIETAGPGGISFLANAKYEPYLYDTGASIVLVSKTFRPSRAHKTNLLRVDDPYTAFTRLLSIFSEGAEDKNGIEQPAYVADSVRIGEGVYIGAFSYIGKDCTIGRQVKIYPGAYIGEQTVIGDGSIVYAGVRIYAGSRIGKNCILHSGAVIGSDGFGFAPREDGRYEKIPQTGNVVLEDEVEIGAQTVIDRATMGSTIIRKGSKLDNLIQVAHNVEIGEHTVIAAQVGISGSTKLGDRCMIGGQVGFSGHLHIAAGTRIAAQSGVIKSVKKENTALLDSPAFDHRQAMRARAVFRRLPDLLKRIEELEQEVAHLRQNS